MSPIICCTTTHAVGSMENTLATVTSLDPTDVKHECSALATIWSFNGIEIGFFNPHGSSVSFVACILFVITFSEYGCGKECMPYDVVGVAKC